MVTESPILVLDHDIKRIASEIAYVFPFSVVISQYNSNMLTFTLVFIC